MNNERYHKYAEDLESASNHIKLPKSVKTERKGLSKVRDTLVFYKSAWAVAEAWAGLPKALVYWLALTPLAITSYNAFVTMIHAPSLAISLEYGSTIAVVMIVVLMAFGLLAWTRFGLNRRAMELGGKQNPTYFLFYDKFEDIIEEVKLLKKEIKELKNEKNSNNTSTGQQ